MCENIDTVLFVQNLMKKYDVGFILITKQNKLLGIITDRDLVCDMAKDTDTIEKYANLNIVTIEETEAIENALKKMKENKIKRLVVTNKNKVTGVLSLSDILQTNTNNELLLETLREIYAINRNDNYFDIDIHDFPL